MLEQAQPPKDRDDERLEHLSRERLRELELIGLEERRLKGPDQYLMEQRQTQNVLSGAQ